MQLFKDQEKYFELLLKTHDRISENTFNLLIVGAKVFSKHLF